MFHTSKYKHCMVLFALVALPFNVFAQYEHLMADVVSEMSVYLEPDDQPAYSELFGNHLRYWMKLEELTTNPFMIEVNRFRYLPPTLDQNKAADDLYASALANIKKKKWYIEEEAIKSGYVVNPEFDSTHYPNKAFLNDGRVFDPEHPEFLIFEPTIYGRVLVGVMFNVENHLDHGPQLGGNLTIWHFHLQPGTCWEGHIRIAFTDEKYCERGTYSDRSPEMIHIWFVKHPAGIFGSIMGFHIPVAELDRVRTLYVN